MYREVLSLIDSFDENDNEFEEPVIDLGLRVIAASQQRKLVGRTIGQFKVLSRLGSGGMGEVYLANDKQLDRRVALKFISSELIDDRAARTQLVTEAKAIARLDHPSICQIFSLQETKNEAFLVMQYVDGVTLSELLKSGPLSETQQKNLIEQLISGLAHIHERHLIHRDLKPGNIMITADGKLKILDFGLATRARKSVSRSRNPTTPGTIRYMSPEQLRGEELSLSTDVFSLGVVMFEIVTGKHLFPQSEVPEVRSAILSGNYPLHEISDSRYSDVITRCLTPAPSQRYLSALCVSAVEGN